MSLCSICLLQLLKHIRAYISFHITDRSGHIKHKVLSFYSSIPFLPCLMYVQIIHINIRMGSQSTVQSKCLVSSLTASGALCPGSLHLDQFSPIHHCTSILYLTSLPTSSVAHLTSLLWQKAICFMISTLWILATLWKETFMNYVEPFTRIPEIAITRDF